MAAINKKIKIDNELQETENIINQFRGYFMAVDDLFGNDALRMLDKLEIILKKSIENNKS